MSEGLEPVFKDKFSDYVAIGVESCRLWFVGTNGYLPTFNFELLLADITPESVNVEYRLQTAGLDDATLVFREGVAYLVFDRNGRNFVEVLAGTLKVVLLSGFNVTAIKSDHLGGFGIKL